MIEHQITIKVGCPWCGLLKNKSAIMEEENGNFAVRCKCCAAVGPWAKSHNSALLRWSRRVNPVTGRIELPPEAQE